jgi:hypothetical protein
MHSQTNCTKNSKIFPYISYEEIHPNEKESGQHTGGHGGGEGWEEFPQTGFTWERPEEEIGGELLVFVLAMEREEEKIMG